MKIFKWILGLLAGVVGLFAMFGGNRESNIKKKIKQSDKKIKKTLEYNKTIKETLKNKKKALKELKTQKEKGPKKKDVGADEAAEFLKKYANKDKN